MKKAVLAHLVTDWDQYDPPEAQAHTRLSWIRFPNSWDSLSFRRLATKEEAPALFSAFVLIAQVASRQRFRGWLVKDGLPLESEDLALMTGFDAQIFTDALDYFTDPKIAWITTAQIIPMEDYQPDKHTEPVYLTGTAGIESIQGIYPKRTWTMETLVAISAAVKRLVEDKDVSEGEAIDEIRKATQDYADLTATWPPADKRNKIPAPPTWFHEDRWKDPDTWTPGRKKKSTTKRKPSDTQLK